MPKTLVIAEKPSVASDIVKALTTTKNKFNKTKEYFENDDFIITSAVGHLLEIKAPAEFEVARGKWSLNNLPVIPLYFELNPIKKTEARLKTVIKLAKRKDVSKIINACDAGREGELIFRLIDQYAGGKKLSLNKPIFRLWLQSMTVDSIRQGFKNLRTNEEMLNLADAARSRAEADWLVGINGTRAMTAFNSKKGGFLLTTVGRVQTPTLSLIVEREKLIKKFISQDYFEIHAKFKCKDGIYLGKYLNKIEKDNKNNFKIWDFKQAKKILSEIQNKEIKITEESKKSNISSPALFDLTSLQREANSRFGISAKNTLAIAQSLYEKHKVLTYPRTDSRFLPEDYLNNVKKTFENLAKSEFNHLNIFAKKALKEEYIKLSKKIFNNNKISDHFAIIPTGEIINSLSEFEQKIYDLVAKRFIAVFYPEAEYNILIRISKIEDYNFKTEGKTLINPGWTIIYNKELNNNDNILPKIEDTELISLDKSEIKKLQTKPLTRYSEATLLSAMETAGKNIENEELANAIKEKGLGTPATRASIIEGLLTEKYIIRNERFLIPTSKAFQLMTLLKGLDIKELSQANLTGDWEYKLNLIEKGELNRQEFMYQISQMTKDLVQKTKNYELENVPGDFETLNNKCLQCGGTIKENYRSFNCINCDFSISKVLSGRIFEITEIEELLVNKKTDILTGFISKRGFPFEAEVFLKLNEENKWQALFNFEEKTDKNEIIDFSNLKSLGECPSCKSQVFNYNGKYICEKSVLTKANNKVTCKFMIGNKILQQNINEAQIKKLLIENKTDLLNNFISNRTKRKFKAQLFWDNKKQKISFKFETKNSK